MVTIEVNNVEIKVPQSWDDVTLGDYETFFKDKPETARQRVEYVAKIIKIEAKVLLEWPAEVFNRLVDLLGFLYADNPAEPKPFIEVEGVQYMVNIEDKILLGEWIDAEEAQKGEDAVLSNVLAVICRPIGETYDFQLAEQRQRMFAALPVSKVLGVLAFFLRCKSVLDSRTEAFTKLQQVADLLPRSIKPFLSRGAGIKLFRIWQVMKYFALIALLRYRLRKLSRSYNIDAIKA